MGVHLPHAHPCSARELPQPYRSMLVHQQDMTGVLERFHDDTIVLDILRIERDEDEIRREVILKTSSGKPVEYGAIRIGLSAFPETARLEISEGVIPLGTILKNHAIEFVSHPIAFFSLSADAMLSDLFAQKPGTLLHGRLNRLVGGDGSVLADVVEILPEV